jgi:peptide/nickel transport system substrate-binding protein
VLGVRSIRRTLAAAVAGAAAIAVIAAIAAVVAGTASGQEGAKPLTLTVALQQDLDSANPTVGVTVAAYEFWNLQYATLTDKASKDFAPIPGLAASWTASADKRTWTYKLRPNLKWSDGQPLTADDVAYTINRARREEWLNYSQTVANVTATAPDPRTVVLKSSVADPKLPVMDVYILPKHVWSKYDKAAIGKYAARDGVGSGPYTLDRVQKGQFWTLKANPNYWRGKPRVDRVVFRKFNNGDAMVSALRRGQVDAVQDVPSNAFLQLQKQDGIATVQGQQGSFNELGMNGGAGLKKPHPALLDRRVREAIARAIDKKTIVERVMRGLAKPADTISPSANPSWMPKLTPDQRFDFDLKRANQILDQAGYKDTNGDGIREMPGGGRPLRLRYAVRQESNIAQPVAEFVTGWLKDIGIATTQKTYSDSQLTEVIGKGDYDLFVWGWTPFVDPDPMMSYFTCGAVSKDPKDPTNYYNDASWCDKTYSAMYKQQNTELDPAKRRAIVQQMLTRFYQSATYVPLDYEPDLQAYRTNRFTGWIRQPAETGPVLFNNSSQTYANLRPVSATSKAGGSGGGGGSGAIIAIVVAAVVVLGGAALVLARRRSADERE